MFSGYNPNESKKNTYGMNGMNPKSYPLVMTNSSPWFFDGP